MERKSDLKNFISEAAAIGKVRPMQTRTRYLACSQLGAAIALVACFFAFAATSHAAAAGCFAKPSACGYPDATNTGVPAGTALTPAASRTITTAGTVISGLEITGPVTVAAKNVTIKNSRIAISKGGNGSYGLILNNGASNFTIEHSEIVGPAGESNGLESAVWNHYGNPGVVARSDYFHHCADCWEGPGTFEDDYMVVDAGYSGSHNEDIYVCGAAVDVEHSTLLNLYHQTATVFGDTASCGGNTFEVKNSLLAGGGFLVYPQANATSATGTMNVSNNRFARCRSGENYDKSTGGTYCNSQSGDANGYYPYGGFYGVAAYYFGGAGNVWTNNVWDDSGKPVCASGNEGCGTASPPPVEKPTEGPVTEAPVETPTESPVEVPTESPVEEAPVETPTEEPPVEIPTKEPPAEEESGSAPPPSRQPLEAILSLPEEILAEVPVVLDGTESNGPGSLSCTWSIHTQAGTDTRNGCLTTYVFPDPGSSSVKLTVRSSRDTDSTRANVTVLPGTPASTPGATSGSATTGGSLSPVPAAAAAAAAAVNAVEGGPAPAPAAAPLDARTAWKAPASLRPRARTRLSAAVTEPGATCAWAIRKPGAAGRPDRRSGCSIALRAPARGSLSVQLTIRSAAGTTTTVRRKIRVA
jgi:hypothetical protein